MKYALWLFLALYGSVAIVACGKSNSGDNPPVAADPIQPNCPPNVPLSTCYHQSGGPLAFSSDNYQRRSITISNGSTYKQFLKEVMAICDRDGYNAGLTSCDSYVNGYMRVTMQVPNTNFNAQGVAPSADLVFEVGPSYNAYSYYWMSLPTGGQLATCLGTYFLLGACMTYPTAGQMQMGSPVKKFQMAVSLVNNSQGFEGRFYGSNYTMSAIKLNQFMVNNGKMTDGYFDYQMSYNGVNGGIYMSGRMIRCADASCSQ